MFRYTLRRLSLLLNTMLVLCIIAYLLQVHAQADAPPSFTGFLLFIGNLIDGNWGTSTTSGLPVLEEIRRHLPPTLELCFAALLISLFVGIPLGTLAGLSKGKFSDLTITSISLVGFSVPTFWLALLVVMLFSLDLGWFPVGGRLSLLFDIEPKTGFIFADIWLSNLPYRTEALYDALRHLALPALVLAVVPTTEVIRQVRIAILDEMQKNYIKAAASKGLSRFEIVRRHALRNALPVVLPVFGLQFGNVLTTAMVTEIVFAWPGMGRWMVDSIYLQDYPSIQGGVLIVAFFLVSVSVFMEWMTALLHPRIRRGLYAEH